MTRTHEKVRYTPKGERYTALTAAQGIEDALKVLEGRWKLIILFHLFGGKVLRFSDLERAIPAISQKNAHPATSANGGGWSGSSDYLSAGSAESGVSLNRMGTGSLSRAGRLA